MNSQYDYDTPGECYWMGVFLGTCFGVAISIATAVVAIIWKLS